MVTLPMQVELEVLEEVLECMRVQLLKEPEVQVLQVKDLPEVQEDKLHQVTVYIIEVVEEEEPPK